MLDGEDATFSTYGDANQYNSQGFGNYENSLGIFPLFILPNSFYSGMFAYSPLTFGLISTGAINPYFAYFSMGSPYASSANPMLALGAMGQNGLMDVNRGLFEKDSTKKPYKSLLLRDNRSPRNPWVQFGERPRPDGISEGKLIDTSLSTVVNTQRLYDSINVTSPTVISIDDYLRYRKEQIQTKIYDSLLTAYDIKKSMSGGDIARMMANATGLSIPIPPNPLTSIFGKPELSLNVGGELTVRIGLRWDSQNLGTVSQFGQTQFSPVFDQDIRLTLSGGIGDKLQLSTDWNTRSSFNNNNDFRIGFEGYDDDIIQRVEVGNISFPLESQLISGGQNLFGVRSDYKFGPVNIRTVLSQRRGERRFVDATGGASAQPFFLRAYDYARNHFLVDTLYGSIYEEFYQFAQGIIPNRAREFAIKEIEVWESTNQLNDVEGVSEAVAVADLPTRPFPPNYDTFTSLPILQGQVERGRFRRLDTMQYEIDRNLGHLTINNLRTDRTYAIAYRRENTTRGPEDDIYVGDFAQFQRETGDTLVLQLVYRPNMQPGFTNIWDRQMRNIYNVGASNTDVSSTVINLWYRRESNDSTDVLNEAPDKLVTIFGVDKVNPAGSEPPDGEFDLNGPYYNPRRGEVVFPTLEPFRDGLRRYFTQQGNPAVAEKYIFNEVYDTIPKIAMMNTARDRFIISVEVKGRSSNRITLGALNLQPGSVRVYLNGRELQENVDYSVEYFSGVVKLRNEAAMLPSADLRVEYEQQDIFQIATKTIVGVDVDYLMFDKRDFQVNLGSTFMHYNQAAQIDRVRLGQEPIANTMLGFNASVNANVPFVTEALDLLPFYDTKVPSTFNLDVETAMVIPEPNKRESSVASDNGQPVVYIDDFESAQRNINIGMNFQTWTHSSPPVDPSIAPTQDSINRYRGKLYWWQYFVGRVPRIEVYPNQQTVVGNRNLRVLNIAFDPQTRGIYNNNPEFLDATNEEIGEGYDPIAVQQFHEENSEKKWGGMQRLFSSFNMNLDQENVEFIEIIMKVDNYEEGKTRMFIDLGQISEDVIANNTLDTEDGIAGNALPNNLVDEGEDVGLDALSDDQERSGGPEGTLQYPFPLNLESDPARDNYLFNFGIRPEDQGDLDFVNYNNYENNATQSQSGRFPDTEILNRNNGQQLSLDNSYFRYEVNLNTNVPNPQVVGNNNGWVAYRIPIRRPTSQVGNPLFSNVQYMRVMVQGGGLRARIADWRLLGTAWQRNSNLQSNVPPNDSVLSVSFVSRFENAGPPTFYTLPPGTRPPQIINAPNPDFDLLQDEKSLVVGVNNLNYGDERMAVRFFNPQDLFFYKEMKFFIHGDGSMPDQIRPGQVPKAYMFLRFGVDSNNYYEYKRPLTRGWQDLGFKLTDLTAIKQIRDTSFRFQRQEFPVPGDDLATFTIRGNPILTRVQFFGFGIENPEENFPNDLTTSMWVNELRLIDPEDSNDWGAVASSTLQMADLASIDASARFKEPNFHELEERFGDRNTVGSYAVNIQGNTEKFLPPNFKKTRLPITYSRSEEASTPQFIANSDVNLEAAAEAAYENAIATTGDEDIAEEARNEIISQSQVVRVKDSWAITNAQLGIPVKHWSIDQTLNRLTLGYSYAQEWERTPVYEERFMWMWNANAAYTNTIPDLLAFTPFSWADGVFLLEDYKNWRVNLLPSNINANIDFRRSRRTEQSRFLDFANPVVREFATNRVVGFTWNLSKGGFLSPTIDYKYSTMSTLLPIELDEFGQQRTGNELAQQIFGGGGGFINLGDDTRHDQTVTVNFKPQIPNIAGIRGFFDLNGSFATTYTWNDPLLSDPSRADIAKNASFNNTIRWTPALRLQDLADKWFGIEKKQSPRGFGRKPEVDTTSSENLDFLGYMGRAFKFIFLDYRKIDFRFNQTNTASNPGVLGGTGMANLWERGLTGRDSRNIYGPSLAYQLGLVGSPHGSFSIGPGDGFPFFGFDTDQGLRPANATLQDNFSQRTTFDINTSRPLWEGATLDITWSNNIGYNKNFNVLTDEFGNPTVTNLIAMESFERSYFHLPTVFGFNVFGSNMQNVIQEYEVRKAAIDQQVDNDPNVTGDAREVARNRAYQQALSDAFYEELETFSFSSGDIGRFLPALNWRITWEGIEEWDFWEGYISRAQIEHVYSSRYNEAAQTTDIGRQVQQQSVQFGFQPLIGVNLTFDEKKFGGRANAVVRYNTTSNYNLSSAQRSLIQTENTDELQINANYTLDGFSFDLLGLELQNDIDLSFLGKYAKSRRATYDVLNPEEADGEGRTLDGTTQITIEPRIRYSLSNRVTASFFVRYDGTFSEGAATPGFSTTQVGFDFRISVAGGR
ncbi:MAG: hypothetical protein Kapaf2KO_20970 [Candidatus Kapaibacteriales bacterium]